MSQTIIVTGASSGIGEAIARYLLRHTSAPNLVLTARRREPLEALQSQGHQRCVVDSGDMSDPSFPRSVVKRAQEKFGRVDAVILNHGTLGNVGRIGDISLDEWRKVFLINVESCVTMIQEALPHLRQSKGRIILTSSGAASHAYSTWGAYGASKAALNHLALTLKVEEPDVTTVSIRPGVVDTAMQQDIREKYISKMDEKDQKKFLSAKKEGTLLKAEQPGHVLANLALSARPELSGQFLSWDDKSLAEYQE